MPVDKRRHRREHLYEYVHKDSLHINLQIVSHFSILLNLSSLGEALSFPSPYIHIILFALGLSVVLEVLIDFLIVIRLRASELHAWPSHA